MCKSLKKSIDILLSLNLKQKKNKRKNEDLYFTSSSANRGRGEGARGLQNEEEKKAVSWPAGWPGATIRFPPEEFKTFRLCEIARSCE